MQPKEPATVLPSVETADSQEWTARILRGAPVLLAYLDTEQRFRYANETHRTWLGINPQELIGQTVIEAGGRRNYQKVEPALARALAGHLASYEGELFSSSERRYAHANFQPYFDQAGQVCGVFTTFVDITGRRTLEMQLLESEQRFFGAFQHAAIGMALVHPDGHFLRVNMAVCHMLGYREDALLALDIAAITHPDDLASDLELLSELRGGKRDSYQMEKRNFHKDGRVVHLQLSVSVVRDEHHQPRYFRVTGAGHHTAQGCRGCIAPRTRTSRGDAAFDWRRGDHHRYASVRYLAQPDCRGDDRMDQR